MNPSLCQTLVLFAVVATLAACTVGEPAVADEAPPPAPATDDAPAAAEPAATDDAPTRNDHSATDGAPPADDAGQADAAGAGEPDDAPTPEAEQWLDRIEARADEIDTLRAQVRYQRIQILLGDEQTRFGQITYDAGPPARFHAHFDRLALHDQLQRQERRYIFDGRWLAERHEDQRLFILRELVPEGEEGQDLLRLGEGPFALPLDLQKDTVVERFTVELVEEDEPAFENAVLLRLTPRPNVQIDQSSIEMWYDRDSLLPVQVRTVNEEDQTESTIRLREIETGVAVDEAVFNIDPPQEPGWQVERRDLE